MAVLRDAYHPAWQATVKGQPAEVVRANIGFKAVRVGKDESEVVFYLADGWRDVLRGGILVFLVIGGFCLVGSLVVIPLRSVSSEPEAQARESSANSLRSAGLWLASMMSAMLGITFLMLPVPGWLTLSIVGAVWLVGVTVVLVAAP